MESLASAVALAVAFPAYEYSGITFGSQPTAAGAHEPGTGSNGPHRRSNSAALLRYKNAALKRETLHEMYDCTENGICWIARASSDPMAAPAIGKLEQQYLQILLLEAMNGGQFSPRETLWAHRWFARWCSGPSLQLTPVNGRVHFEPKGFVVDMGGSDGLKRASPEGDKLLYFDSSPLSA